MKFNSLKKLVQSPLAVCLLIIHLLIFSTVALAAKGNGGVIGGGGGDTIIDKKTGEIISLADPIALLSPQGKRIRLPESVRDELSKILRIAEGYFFLDSRFDSLTSESNVDYRLIEEIPTTEICQERIKYKETEDSNTAIAQAACTSGKKTWLKKSSYEELLKMPSKRELALLLVHEGLRRVPNLSNEDLVSITNGLRFVMLTYDDQSLEQMATIDENGKNTIYSMVESILLNGLSKNGDSMSVNNSTLDTYEVSDFGGLVPKNSNIHKTARIGVGSVVEEKIIVGANVTMIGTLYTGVRYDRSCNYKSCVILPIEIPENVKLVNSRISLSGLGALSKDSLIVNSTVTISDIVGPNANINNSTVGIFQSIGANARIDNSKINGLSAGDNLRIISSTIIPKMIDDDLIISTIKIGNNVTIENSNVSFLYSEIKGVTLANNITLKNIKKATFTNIWNGNDLFPLFSLGVLSNGELELQEGSNLDFKGKQICNNAPEDKFLSGVSNLKIKSMNELVKYCTSK